MNQSGNLKLEYGFTLIELVVTVIIVGIIAVIALPKLFNYTVYQQRTLLDDTLNASRYAQKLAVATSCNVLFQISNNQYTVLRPTATDRSKCSSITPGDFTLSVSRPGTNETSYQGSITGINLSAVTLFFLPKGNALNSATITVGSRTINIIQDTGYVYTP